VVKNLHTTYHWARENILFHKSGERDMKALLALLIVLPLYSTQSFAQDSKISDVFTEVHSKTDSYSMNNHLAMGLMQTTFGTMFAGIQVFTKGPKLGRLAGATLSLLFAADGLLRIYLITGEEAKGEVNYDPTFSPLITLAVHDGEKLIQNLKSLVNPTADEIQELLMQDGVQPEDIQAAINNDLENKEDSLNINTHNLNATGITEE
jgi:hypothetical protein